jgi:hypothetical protein
MAVTTPNAKKNPAGVRHLSTPDILAAMMTDSDDDEPVRASRRVASSPRRVVAVRPSPRVSRLRFSTND